MGLETCDGSAAAYFSDLTCKPRGCSKAKIKVCKEKYLKEGEILDNGMNTIQNILKGNKMKHYVLGFVFNQNRTKVLLIQKKRPSWQADHWNGIGGKIKKYSVESPLQAMQRECKEETNWSYNWQHCITFVCSGGTVFVYKAISDYKSATEKGCNIIFEQMEDEELFVWSVDSLPDKKDREVDWIIPILLSAIRFPICVHLEDIEKQTEKSNGE